MTAIEAVTFDYWDTICCTPDVGDVRRQRAERLAGVLAGASDGARLDVDAVDQALRKLLATQQQHWAANRQFTYVDGVSLLEEELSLSFDDADRVEVELGITGERGNYIPDLTPNVGDALDALKSAGLRIGIVCDVGLSPSRVLRRHLDRHGVLDFFDHWSFSDEVGCYKPAPEIFAHALAGLGGVAPERAAHVGDLRRTDIGGARAMGMTAVRYTGITDDPPAGEEPIEGHHVISDHADLAALLGA